VLERARAERPIGDPDFDQRFRVTGDELAWRLMLAPDVRAMLVEVFGAHESELQRSEFVVRLHDEDADGPLVERLLRAAVTLGTRMGMLVSVDDSSAALLARVRDEPAPGIRRGHYEWLLACGYDTPDVLRLAAGDDEEAIRTWAQAQRPRDELYR
nr:hypothetical protein [Deltaproteobacteria bacterium]